MKGPESMSSRSVQASATGSSFGKQELPFLATKIVPPQCPGLIARPRLLDMVYRLASRRLAVLRAPAGFGKTSLAVSWLQRLEGGGSAVAWLTIDPEDDEPATFFFYVAHALQRAVKGVGGSAINLIRESFLIDTRAIVLALMNDLADIEDEVYLVLEDYHWITKPEIHEALSFFLKRAPSHCHIVITARNEPALPLISLRAQNQLLEIDAANLRFEFHETRDFLKAEDLGALDLDEAKLLHEKTEGWPAALRIVASSSIGSKHDIGQYLRGLSDTQRPIGAYIEEMLNGLPDELVQFMLRTSILDRLCAPLCDAVAKADSARDLLAEIGRRQLLMAPVDQEGQWYRYHPLLSEHLSERVREEVSDEVAGLHHRAALWYAAQELWTEAVQHAIAAGESAQALDWVKNGAMPLVKRGDLFTLLGWQRLFPAEVMRSQPEVMLAIAWGLALALRFGESLELLAEIEKDLERDSEPSSGKDALRCELAAIRAVSIALKDDSQQSLSVALDCVSRSTDPWTANVASNVVRFGHLKAGDLKKFYATPWLPYSLDEDRRNVFAAVYYRCIQGMAETQQLRIAAAERFYLDALRLAEQHAGVNSVAAALPSSLIARIRYEQGRLDEAEAMLVDRGSLITAGTMLDCVLSAYFVMVRTAAHRGNLGRAYTLLELADNLGNSRGWGRLNAAAAFEKVRLCLAEGRIEEAAGCLDRLDRLGRQYKTQDRSAWSDIGRFAAFAHAYVASAHGRFEDAIAVLETLLAELEGVQNLHLASRVEIYLATVKYKAKQHGEAIESFSRVLSTLANAGVYYSILDEGGDVGPLLAGFQENAKRKGFHDLDSFVAQVTAAWRARYQQEPAQLRASPIAELLSTREIAILRLIGAGQSNKEIARNLSIAPETVKTHVKNIFGKLRVERRAQAVSRAQTMGLAVTG